MNKWAKEIADGIRESQPQKNNTNIYRARVESSNPFKATIGGGTFVLTEKNTISIIESFFIANLSGDFTVNGFSSPGTFEGELKLKDRLKAGDEVLVMTDKEGQTFYLIGKVARL